MSNKEEESPKEHIPVFKTWGGWYVLLVVVLGTLIGLFALLTQAFS